MTSEKYQTIWTLIAVLAIAGILFLSYSMVQTFQHNRTATEKAGIKSLLLKGVRSSAENEDADEDSAADQGSIYYPLHDINLTYTAGKSLMTLQMFRDLSRPGVYGVNACSDAGDGTGGIAAISTRYYQVDGEGNVVCLGVALPQSKTIYDQPIIVLPKSMKTGDVWAYDTNGATGSYEVLGFADTVASAKTYPGCLMLQHSGNDLRFQQTEYYAPKIGLVKIVNSTGEVLCELTASQVPQKENSQEVQVQQKAYAGWKGQFETQLSAYQSWVQKYYLGAGNGAVKKNIQAAGMENRAVLNGICLQFMGLKAPADLSSKHQALLNACCTDCVASIMKTKEADQIYTVGLAKGNKSLDPQIIQRLTNEATGRVNQARYKQRMVEYDLGLNDEMVKIDLWK